MFDTKNVTLYYKNKRLENLTKVSLQARKDSAYLTVEVIDHDDQFDFYVVDSISILNNNLQISVMTVEESLSKMRNYSSSEKVINMQDYKSSPKNKS